MDWISLFENAFWFGLASLGFAILFNVPERTLPSLFFIAILGGIIKTLALNAGINISIATLFSSFAIGVICIPAAHNKHAPPLVFAIPSVIPLVPGVYAYRMMIGLISLSSNVNAAYQQTLYETINYGLKVLFILLSLSAGVALPMLVTRQQSAKHIKLKW